MRIALYAVVAFSVATVAPALAAQSTGFLTGRASDTSLEPSLVRPGATKTPRMRDAVPGAVPLEHEENPPMSATKRGALIGAGIGFAAGLYGGIRVADGIGCTSPGCNASFMQAREIVLLSAVGTGIGALIGAGVGSLIHAIRPASAAGR